MSRTLNYSLVSVGDLTGRGVLSIADQPVLSEFAAAFEVIIEGFRHGWCDGGDPTMVETASWDYEFVGGGDGKGKDGGAEFNWLGLSFVGSYVRPNPNQGPNIELAVTGDFDFSGSMPIEEVRSHPTYKSLRERVSPRAQALLDTATAPLDLDVDTRGAWLLKTRYEANTCDEVPLHTDVNNQLAGAMGVSMGPVPPGPPLP